MEKYLAAGPMGRSCPCAIASSRSVRAFRMGPGLIVGRTMTVIVTDDGLVVANAARLSTTRAWPSWTPWGPSGTW
ncbi:MAG: hypothetical protein R3F43_12075 [bacterium]